jgi:imidazolonepropionase-like amidohydrolase
MEHLVEAGLSHASALDSATRIAAKALGLDGVVGQVRHGFVADLVAVDGEPEKDLSIFQDPGAIRIVIQGGQTVVDRR